MDVLVGGVSFDALQVGVRVLWEIKTHRFDKYPDFIQKREIEKEMKQLNKQRKAAAACGYDFVIGVRMRPEISFPGDFPQERMSHFLRPRAAEKTQKPKTSKTGKLISGRILSTDAHKLALLQRDQSLDIVVTGCKR